MAEEAHHLLRHHNNYHLPILRYNYIYSVAVASVVVVLVDLPAFVLLVLVSERVVASLATVASPHETH